MLRKLWALLGLLGRSNLESKPLRGEDESAQDIFRNIYKNNYWGDVDSRSGAGSNLRQTAEIRRALPMVIDAYNIKTMLDIPCGDWHWMKEAVLDVDYIGADIVPELIQRNQSLYESYRCRFTKLDLTSDDLPKVNLIFSRDVLVHLSFKDIFSAFRNIKRSGSKYFLTTTFTGRGSNVDIPTGHWRPLNLQKAPFNLPEPLMLIEEKCTEGDGSWGDKSLGMWRVSDLNEKAS